MKRPTPSLGRLALALLLAAALGAGAALAQTGGGYDLTWSTIDTGGGASAGGSYTLAGTLGQPDAGAAQGGSYALSGGFWAGAQAGGRIYLPVVSR